MADQPLENPAGTPPGGPGSATPDPTRIDGSTTPEPTRIEGSATPEPTRIEGSAAPEPARIEGSAAPEPTRVEGSAGGGSESAAGGSPAARDEQTAARDEQTAARDEQAAARWSGSAAVPPHVPKKAWWSRRRGPAEDGPPPAVDPWADSEDWSATPAVDPWAEHDTPWQAEPLPPTRIDAPLPPTRTQPQLPPTRLESPMPPPAPPAATRPPAAPPTGTPPGATFTGAAPGAPAAPAKRRWWGRGGRGGAAEQAPAAPVNRPPVASRPATPPRGSRTAPPAAAPALPATPARPAPPPWAPQPWAPPPGAPAPGAPAPGAPARSRPPGAPARGRPPTGRPDPRPAPPRRRRRWPRRLALFTLASFLCCCGVPGYFAWPAAQQYPVSADLPQSVSDLDLRDDGASRRAIERLTGQLADSGLVNGDVFAGIYTDGHGKKVTIFGNTGLRLTPEADVEAEIAHLADEYHIENVEAYDLGEAGLHERCGVGRSGGNAVVVCAWADHGSLATVLLTRRSVGESADLTGVLRDAVLTRQ
jgi:hypothetical protein